MLLASTQYLQYSVNNLDSKWRREKGPQNTLWELKKQEVLGRDLKPLEMLDY